MSTKPYRWRYSNYDQSHIQYALKNAARMYTWTPDEKIPYHLDYLQMMGGTFSIYITKDQKENIQPAVKYLIGMQDVVGNVNVVIVSKETMNDFFIDRLPSREREFINYA